MFLTPVSQKYIIQNMKNLQAYKPYIKRSKNNFVGLRAYKCSPFTEGFILFNTFTNCPKCM